MYSITEAKVADINAMASLLQYLFAQEADFVPQQQIQEQGLQAILDNPYVGKLFVAKDQNKVVGMVNILYTISTAVGGKVAILEDMVVHPDYRNKGIGSKLIHFATNYAFENGCLRITLLTDLENERAHEFYQSKGFKISSMVPFRLLP